MQRVLKGAVTAAILIACTAATAWSQQPSAPQRAQPPAPIVQAAAAPNPAVPETNRTCKADLTPAPTFVTTPVWCCAAVTHRCVRSLSGGCPTPHIF
ncbi:MAG TPA: hypothetical protein VGE98_07035, partial [Thermoanaerobaculia bacterium]